MSDDTAVDVAPLRLQADWGGANLTRAAGWLTQWVWEQTPEHRRSVIRNGRGMGDNLAALGAGEVDVAIATPASFALLARDGRGPFAGRGIPGLVAIGALPHRDAMVPVVRADLGIRSLAELAADERPLRLSLGVNDPDGFMGFGGDAVLASAGVDLAAVERRGGVVTRHEQPFDAIADLREGRADVMVSEAIMTPDWQRLATEQDVVFLSLGDRERTALTEEWGLDVIEIPAGYFPGMDAPLIALDYSDWIVATTTSLDDATAALLARAFIENAEQFQRGYRHLPVDYSPLRYPIDPASASATSVPLHPAAAAEYARVAAEHDKAN